MKRLFAFLALMALLFGLYQIGQKFLLPPVVEITKPTRGAAVEAVYATGTVEPSVMMPIAPRSAARLIALNADEGATVTKDQVLAQLEDTDLQGTITELQARVDFAKRELDRKTSLVNKGVAARQSLDQAQTEWDAAKASLARAQSQADFMKLTAPADGVIVRRDGEVGQLIPANQPVFWLSCCAPLRIATEVDEEDIAKVKIGQKVYIRADAFSDQVFDGTVQSITPKGDPVSRSYRVRVSLPATTPLMIGMTAETNIVLSEKSDALLVPVASVKDGKIQTVQNGAIHIQPVTTGAIGADQTEIVSGIGDNENVVTPFDPALKDKQKIRAQTKKTP